VNESLAMFAGGLGRGREVLATHRPAGPVVRAATPLDRTAVPLLAGDKPIGVMS
jgi:hypothetical protein